MLGGKCSRFKQGSESFGGASSKVSSNQEFQTFRDGIVVSRLVEMQHWQHFWS